MSNSPREPSKIVEDLCWRFECAWKNAPSLKQRSRVEDFLREAPEAQRDQLLLELVGLDVDYRRAQGEAPQAQEYRERFPSVDRAWLDRLLPAAATIASDAPKPTANVRSDHNLLLGILAYQNAFITREALFAAMQAWLYDKAKALAVGLRDGAGGYTLPRAGCGATTGHRCGRSHQAPGGCRYPSGENTSAPMPGPVGCGYR